MKNKKRYIPTIIFTIVIIVGISIMLYPVLISSINSGRENHIIEEYSNKVKELRQANYDYLFEEARKYNQSLTNDNIVDAFSKDDSLENEEYNKLLNINNDGVIGYIRIPKIDVHIPIYHGTSTKVLEKGVGHFEKSSLPVGGDGTHSILSGHRGLPSSRLFSDLNQLQEGDLFYIYVLDQILAYKVDKVSVVEPDDIENLKMEEGKDYVTLVTCTPYAINTHRLLVRGTRITYNEEEFKSIKVNKKLSTSDITLIGGLITVVI
ncbi:MAG: class C sortase, partial [Bacilli bacterium]|nr:class C sortase [Bacilli bacterium]